MRTKEQAWITLSWYCWDIQSMQHLKHVLPFAEEGHKSTSTTEQKYFSMQDTFFPAARLALTENLEKQAVKTWKRRKDCKVSSFVKGCVKASSESSALFWHPNATSNLWLYANSALGVKLLAVCLDFTAFLGLETEREGVQRHEYWDYFINLVCFSFLFTRSYWCL